MRSLSMTTIAPSTTHTNTAPIPVARSEAQGTLPRPERSAGFAPGHPGDAQQWQVISPGIRGMPSDAGLDPVRFKDGRPHAECNVAFAADAPSGASAMSPLHTVSLYLHIPFCHTRC